MAEKLTFEAWKQRWIGAFMEVSGCDEDEAEKNVSEYVESEVNLDEDCPVASAHAYFNEEYEQPGDVEPTTEAVG